MNDNPRVVVTEIYRKLKLEQSVASQHLAILRNTGFLIAERDGRSIHYSVNDVRFEEIITVIGDLQ